MPAQPITFPIGGSVFSTTAGNKTITTTPAAGDGGWICIGFTTITFGPADAVITDNNADGFGTTPGWALIVKAAKNSGNDWLGFFVRKTNFGSATSTSVVATLPTNTGGGGMLETFHGASRTWATGLVRGSGLRTNQTAGTTPAPVLPAAAISTSTVISIVMNATNPAGITNPAVLDTQVMNTGYNTPTTGMNVGFNANAGVTATTITWGSTSSEYGALVVELDSTAAATTGALPPGMGARQRDHMIRRFERWERKRSGILVPRLWTPSPIAV